MNFRRFEVKGEKNKGVKEDFSWRDILETIPNIFDSPDQLRELQEELQGKFLQLNFEKQKEIMNGLSQETGKLFEEKEEIDDENEIKKIEQQISKIRILLQTFHRVYHLPEK